MKLLPTLKQKRRYVVFEVIGENNFTLSEIKEEVERALQQFWGDLGKSRAVVVFIDEKFNPEKQRFMLKVNHKYVDELKMGLALSKKIKNNPIIFKSVVSSGTIKKASSNLV